MGSNPSKSQQLQSMFPQYKILPQLSLNSQNIYELIYVIKPKTNQIFTIKESLKENTQTTNNENVIKCIQFKKIDNVYYTLYEWFPLSIKRYIQSYPQIVNRDFSLYIIQTVIKTYTILWKSCEGVGLDITAQNIRAFRDTNGKIYLKILPPYLTFSSFPQRKFVYRNQISDLGQTLSVIFRQKQNYIGKELSNFIFNRIKGYKGQTDLNSWDKLMADLKNGFPPTSVLIQQLNHMKYCNTPIRLKQNNQRPIYNLTPNKLVRQQIVVIQNDRRRSISPYTGNRDISISKYNNMQNEVHKNISKITTLNTDANPCVTINQVRTQPFQSGRGNKNQYPAILSQNKIQTNLNRYSNLKQKQSISPRLTHQYNAPITMHQNIQRNEHIVNTNNNRHYQTQNNNLITAKNYNPIVSPSPVRYFNCNSNSAVNINKVNLITNHNVSNFNECNNQNNYTTIQTNKKTIQDPLPSTKQITSKQEQIKNNTVNTQQQSIQNEKISKNLNNIQQQKIINKHVPVFGMFQPSSRDHLQIRPKLGVPLITFTPKTKQDVQLYEQNKKDISNKQSDNLIKSGQNFIDKHLNSKDIKVKQLLGSSISLVHVDKQSSFGLTLSQDSEVPDYEGVYTGAFHPNFSTIKHGVGKLMFPSGGSYQGNFAWNKMDGWGKLFYPSGRLAYEGYWNNSRFEGYGKLFNESPRHLDLFDYTNFNLIQFGNDQGYWKYYQGNMKSDMKQGHGIWVLQNGEKFDGEFLNDIVHGFGTFYGKKEIVQGKWQNNILVQIIKKS